MDCHGTQLYDVSQQQQYNIPGHTGTPLEKGCGCGGLVWMWGGWVGGGGGDVQELLKKNPNVQLLEGQNNFHSPSNAMSELEAVVQILKVDTSI